MKRIHAVLFDLDGTLIKSTIDFQKMKTKSIHHLERSGVQPGLLTTDMLNPDIEMCAQDILKNKGATDGEITTIFTEVTRIMNDVELEALATIQPYADAPETLRQIHELGLKIGVITRGCHEYAEAALRITQLRRFIDAIVARDDVSHPKPNPEHPRHLLHILGVNPSHGLFVGDTPTDILCAHNARMPSVWLNRKDASLPLHTPQPDYEIHGLADLVDILTRMT